MADRQSGRDGGAGNDAAGSARDMAQSARAMKASARDMAAWARDATESARESAGERLRDKGKRARELNEQIRYTIWSVFRLADPAALGDSGGGRDTVTVEVADLLEQAAGKGVTTRGSYDVQGLRADADYMFWWIAESPDDLQETYARFRRTRLGRASQPVWSVMALHRPAEFNKGHIPAFLADEEPRNYVSVYPFVRSYEWYLLDPEDRRSQLAEHGMMAREFPDVRANTVACFALNDYEWILAFEADELHRILDLMRHLRGARARRHTRAETPFFAGRRKPVAELIAALP